MNLPKRLRIRPRAPLVTPMQVTTAAPGLVRPRGYSGESMLSRDEQMTEAEAKSVVMAQPHRAGVGENPNDAWQATASGRLCRRFWDGERAHEHWEAGERYAWAIDEVRRAQGFAPRQCAPPDQLGVGLSDEERTKLIRTRVAELAEIERVLSNASIWAVRWLAYDDRDLPEAMEFDARCGLHALAVYFERKSRRR